MRQYHSVKERVPQALLFFRLGDFYELFYDDAVNASKELGITLTARNKEKGQAVPMCGVPFHAAEGYINRLVTKGYRVAICDQMEQAGPGKKLVRRDLTRIITPGTATDASLLRSGENNYLAALLSGGDRAGVAFADVSTGEFRVTETDAAEARSFIESLNAREVLEPENGLVDGWVFDFDQSERSLREHFRLLSLDGCGLAGKHLAVGAAGAVLHYLKETQRSALSHLSQPSWFERTDAMVLDAVTIRNLEIVEPLFSEDRGSKRDSTLIGTVDRTLTGMGARLMRKRLIRPSLDLEEINTRLDGVEELAQSTIARSEIRKTLERVLDLERLLAKLSIGTGNARDALALGRSLEQLPLLRNLAAPLNHQRLDQMDELPDIRARILETIADEPPVNITDGWTIRSGCSQELDELRDIQTNSRQFIAAIEVREKQRTSIQSLKVRFNNVFGYYIEISKANLQHVPADYERKQTLVNAERFTTSELKELESKILEAEEKILGIEKALFEDVRNTITQEASRIRVAADLVAHLDVTAGLAELAVERRYTRPRFSGDDGHLQIEAGRHPVIEVLADRDAQQFTPNDLYLDGKQFLAILTGPNMGGKSTYLRQAALIVIMAQAGSFVPASAATLPIVDRVFTRIGASDNLSRGRSTFMVEMTETAMILNTATKNSLIVLDEIGRGTATYDGLAIAWSVAEYIHQRIQAKTLFATHYHELTDLGNRLPGVRNLRVSVKELTDQIIFLRKVEPGSADKSYGIEVARLAALPAAVIERAREVLTLHERQEQVVSDEIVPSGSPLQIQLFEPVNGALADRIRSLNLDELKPIEALQLLADLQKDLK